MDHSRALGAADEMNSFARHVEGGGGCLGASVSGANSKREFGERARGRAAIAGDAAEGGEEFSPAAEAHRSLRWRQRDFSVGMADEAARCFFHRLQ